MVIFPLSSGSVFDKVELASVGLLVTEEAIEYLRKFGTRL